MQWKYFIPSIYLVFILLHIILKLPRPRRIFLEFALFYIFQFQIVGWKWIMKSNTNNTLS